MKLFIYNYYLKRDSVKKLICFALRKSVLEKADCFGRCRMLISQPPLAHQHAERWDASRNSFSVTHRANQLSCLPVPTPEWCKCSWLSLCGCKHHETVHEYTEGHWFTLDTGWLVIPFSARLYLFIHLFIHLCVHIVRLWIFLSKAAPLNCRHIYLLQVI